jgi:hypothetical protein
VLAAASYKPDGQLRRAALVLRPVSEAEEPHLALEVPLLRHRRGVDGAETPLARPQPRVTAAKLAQTLEAALSALSGGSGEEDGSGGGGGGGGGAAGGAAPWEAVQGVAWGAGGGAAGRQGGGS